MFGQCAEMIKINVTGTMGCTETKLVEHQANTEKLYKLTGSGEINVWFIERKTVECV